MMSSHSPRQEIISNDFNSLSANMSSNSAGPSVEFADIAHSNDDSSLLLHPDSISSTAHSDASNGANSLPFPAGGGAQPQAPSNASFYQLAYYQHNFDVTTLQIRDRLVRALMPFYGPRGIGAPFYYDEDPKPDLYGPFWITSTLIFLLAACGNFANYIEFHLNDSDANNANSTLSTPQQIEKLVIWSYDFQKVSVGASVFYVWISVIPLAVSCFFTRVGSDNGAPQKGWVEIASLFGYSLVSFLPVCIMCVPPISLLRWVSVSVAFVCSSYFLLRNLGANLHNKSLLPVIFTILVLNLALAFLTKFYFFDF